MGTNHSGQIGRSSLGSEEPSAGCAVRISGTLSPTRLGTGGVAAYHLDSCACCRIRAQATRSDVRRQVGSSRSVLTRAKRRMSAPRPSREGHPRAVAPASSSRKTQRHTRRRNARCGVARVGARLRAPSRGEGRETKRAEPPQAGGRPR